MSHYLQSGQVESCELTFYNLHFSYKLRRLSISSRLLDIWVSSFYPFFCWFYIKKKKLTRSSFLLLNINLLLIIWITYHHSIVFHLSLSCLYCLLFNGCLIFNIIQVIGLFLYSLCIGCLISFLLFLTVPGGMWDLSYPTTDWTHALCIRIMKS